MFSAHKYPIQTFRAIRGPKAPPGAPLRPHLGSWGPHYLEMVTNGATMQSFMILAQTICSTRANILSRLFMCIPFQGPRLFWPKIAEIAKSGQKSQHATKSVIWPRIKKCHKIKITFHPHFCSKFQGPIQFWPKIAEIAKSGRKEPARDQIPYLASDQKMS